MEKKSVASVGELCKKRDISFTRYIARKLHITYKNSVLRVIRNFRSFGKEKARGTRMGTDHRCGRSLLSGIRAGGQFRMFSADKVFLFLVAGTLISAETTKRDLIALHPGLEYLHLGGFGPVSRLPSHPAFAHLGLTSQQAVGLMSILLQNGFLSHHALKLPGGQPFPGDFHGPNLLPGHYGFPGLVFDPYFSYLLSNHARFLPFGLGPQGIYGSTGLPKARPLGVFKHPDKN